MKVLYFDCFSGISGDMALGALIDAGASPDAVRRALDSLDLSGWRLEIGRTHKGPLRACDVKVVVSGAGAPRTYRDILGILEAAPLGDGVRRRARAIFERLAEAEARVHGVEKEDVHFHEVGALDAILDVVGVAAALEDIGADLVVSSSVTDGRGITSSQHGPIPIPAPAVVELLRGAPVSSRGEDELVTPTGAAILAASVDRFGAPPEMRVARVGYGAGDRDGDVPNVLRVMVGDSAEGVSGAPGALLLETNIDDMSPELIPHVIEKLLGAGADDAWTTPIIMKKGRPAITLSALVGQGQMDRAMDVLFAETTTLGVRIRAVSKQVLDREWVSVDVESYPVRMKVARREGRIVNVAPEYDDASKVAGVTGLPLKEVYRRALGAFDPDD